MLFTTIVKHINAKILRISRFNVYGYIQSWLLHRRYYKKIFSSIPKNGHKNISKNSLRNFFASIDDVSRDVGEYHAELVKTSIMEECIPIKNIKIELHTICASIYQMDGAHQETIHHLTNVTDFSTHVYDYLKYEASFRKFLDKQTMELISMAAFMHDISKIIIDKDFLYDGRKFNVEEAIFMRTHPLLSTILIDYIKERNPHLTKYLDIIKGFVIDHHERLDGSGYPTGKKHNEISIGGKILAVADTYEAMTATGRKYKQPLDVKAAFTELFNQNSKYDQEIVRGLYLFIFNKIEVDIIIERDLSPKVSDSYVEAVMGF